MRLVAQVRGGRTGVAAVARAGAAGGAKLKHALTTLSAVSFDVPAAAAPGLTRSLSARQDVMSIVPAAVRRLSYQPNDPFYPRVTTYLAAVGAPAAWKVTKGSASVKIAEVVATLDGQQVGRVHDGALLFLYLMWDGAPGPKLELGDRSHCYWHDAFHHPLSRQSSPGSERIVVIGTSGTTLASNGAKDMDPADLDSTRHSLNWLAQTTTAELVLAELMTMGMATLSLWSLPGKLLNQAANGSRSNV